jgi:hypothetical protein
MTRAVHAKYVPGAFVALTILLALGAARASALTVTVTGSWTVTLAVGDLQSGAGSNLVSTKTSLANQVLIDVNPPASLWTVWISKTDVLWNSPLALWARRTGPGAGAGADPTGGAAYQEVTGSSLAFFDGDKKRDSIPIQYEIRNIAVAQGVHTFSTNVQYTITAR